MEEEAEKLKEMQGEVDQMLNTPPNKAGQKKYSKLLRSYGIPIDIERCSVS